LGAGEYRLQIFKGGMAEITRNLTLNENSLKVSDIVLEAKEVTAISEAGVTGFLFADLTPSATSLLMACGTTRRITAI